MMHMIEGQESNAQNGRRRTAADCRGISPFRSAAWRLAWLWLMMAIVGCRGSTSKELKLEPVRGTITVDGKPYSNLAVNFIPTASKNGCIARGYTDEQGEYELTAAPGGKGVPASEYRVIVSKLIRPDGSDFPTGESSGLMNSPGFPVEYRGPGGSALKANVRVGPNTIDFRLSSSNVPSGSPHR